MGNDFSMRNNASDANFNGINRSQPKLAAKFGVNGSGQFGDLEEALSFSPGRGMEAIYKNQSVFYRNFQMASLRQFEHEDKFYSAQKEKGKSHENQTEPIEKNYRELIDTFKNYQGQFNQTSTLQSIIIF